MRRIIHAVTLTVIVASAGIVVWQNRPTSVVLQAPIDRFEVGQQKQVHFRVASETLESLSDDALDEQLLDWLLYAALDASTLDAEGLRDVMYDLPPTRAQYVHPVAAFDFGPVRFRIIDDAGSVIALIPVGSPQRADLIAQIADAVRTRLGSAPRVLRVLEYRVDPLELSASLTRTADVSGDELYTATYGYVERYVRNVGELETFLKETGDLVSAVPTSGGLTLGGRRLADGIGRKLTVEDVAALWQSEAVLAHDQQLIEQLNAKWDDKDNLNKLAEQIHDRERQALLLRFPQLGESRRQQAPQSFGTDNEQMRRLLEQLARENPSLPDLSAYGRSTENRFQTPAPDAEAALREFKRRWDDPRQTYLTGLLRAQYEQELASLKNRFQLKGIERVPDGSGFSLDPAYDYAKLRNVVALHRLELSQRAGADDVAAIEQELTARREGKLLTVLYRLAQRPGDAEFVQAVENDIRRAAFQHARYDGTLKGTEVGMVLFYTDLVAKLWALDYEESAPAKRSESYVRGFVPLLKVASSPIYDEENRKLTKTRLWFGPGNGAFAKKSDRLLFARIATRVYAASSNSLQPGKEAEANANSSSFLGWWNDHYAQIAEFEPEYQRLNQIMKWSTTLAWLSSVDQLHALRFLDENAVRVKRDNWFPEWARANTRLKFRGWDSIPFMPRGFQGIDAESIDRLYSRPYPSGNGFRTISGGVSLASREKLVSRPTLFTDAPPRLRRANIAQVTHSHDGLALRSFDQVNYTLRTAAPRQPAVVEAKSTTKLRGRDLEVKQGAFELRFERHREGIRARVGVNDRAVGELTVSRRGSEVIEVAFEPLEIEFARAFSKTLSRATATGDDGLTALAARADVTRVIEREGTYYVESTSRRPQWLKITPEGKPSADLGAGADLRFARLVSAFERGGDRWTVSFIDRARVDTELLREARYIVQRPSGSPAEGVAFSVSARGPPEGAHRVIDLQSLPTDSRSVLAAIDDAGRGNGNRATGGRNLFDGEGGRGRLAREAAKDPDGTVALLADTRKRHIDHADTLLHEGRFEEASIELDRLAAVLPLDLEVASRRVVVHAASGSRIAAAEAARLPIDANRLPSFLEFADRAAAQLMPNSPQHQHLTAVVRGIVARAYGHDAHYINLHGELGIEVRLATANWTSASVATPLEGAPRYSLASLDAPVVVNGSAIPIPPGSSPITGKLRDATVAAVEPDVIVDLRTGSRYQNSTVSPAGAVSGQSFRTAYSVAGNTCGAAGEGQGQNGSDCRDTVYLTRPQSGNASVR
jgi:hypothetical protein